MKTKFCSITALFLLMSVFYVSAQVKADKVCGYYITYNDDTKDESSQIQIFKSTNGKYYGKIIWLKEPNENGKPKVDDENPDKSLRDKPLIGLQLLKGFSYDEKNNEWIGGTIYDPDNGKTYNCFIKFGEGNDLKIRGFIGKAWMGLGRTAVWKRVEAPRK